MCKTIAFVAAAFFVSGCAAVSPYSNQANSIKIKHTIKYSQPLKGMQKPQVVDTLGYPDSSDVYYPRCNTVEVWDYCHSECTEGLHLVLVNGIVTDVGYW